jgi:adenosylhomocysteine nucleosidase
VLEGIVGNVKDGKQRRYPLRRVAILAPMHPELRPLRRPFSLRRIDSADGALFTGALGELEVIAAIAGIGTHAAARTTERLLDRAKVDHLVVVGIAGAIAASLGIGDLVVPERVLDLASGREYRPTPLGSVPARGTLATSDVLVTQPDALARLEREGVVAIDMETAAIATVCERRSVAWSVFRAISDRAGAGPLDPEILRLAGPEGRPAPLALARFLLSQPWRVAQLFRLGRDSRRATRAAAGAARAALAGASLPARSDSQEIR